MDQFGRVQPQAYLSGPISDTLSARVAFAADEGGAWQKGYVTTGRRIGNNDQLSGRVLLDWDPIPSLKFSLDVNGTRNKGEPEAFQLHAYDPVNPAAANPAFNAFIATNARQAETTTPIDLDNDSWQTALRSEWSISHHLKLISITNFVTAKSSQDIDYDGTSIQGFEGGELGRASSFSQELRIAGDLPSARLNYVVGGYYQNDRLLDVSSASITDVSIDPPGLSVLGRFPQTNRAVGAFANADWEIIPGLTLTGGARYTRTRQSEEGCTVPSNSFTAAVFGVSLGQCLTLNDVVSPASPAYFQPISQGFGQSQSEDNVSWRAGVNYKLNHDLLLYGLISRGYKAGSYNVGLPFLVSGLNPVRQEQLTSYEAGTKETLFDRKLSFTLSAFHYDYDDKQFQTYIPSPLGALEVLTNIPRSTVSGVDAEAVVTINDLSLNGGLTYADTKVGTFQTFDITLQPIDISGNAFNLAPKISETFSATYRPKLTDGLRGVLSLNGVHHSSTNSDLVQTPNLEIPAYTVLDGLIGVESQRGWRVSVWVRNLTDKYYATTTAASADFDTWLAGRPRTFGATFGYDF